jgi:hypothetical protein
MSFLKKCYCCENLVHAVHRCDTVLKFWVAFICAWLPISFNTAQIPNQQSRLPESMILSLWQCICKLEGTYITRWKCSTHDRGTHYLKIILCDKEVRVKHLSLRDKACGTNDVFKLTVVLCLGSLLPNCLGQPSNKIHTKV